jgi:hypothetical protein
VWAEKSRKFHERIRGERVIPREAFDKLGNESGSGICTAYEKKTGKYACQKENKGLKFQIPELDEDLLVTICVTAGYAELITPHDN